MAAKGFPGIQDEEDSFHSMVWNWGRISRDLAVDALKGHEEGTFLVRMSETSDDQYSISVVQDGEVRHIRILNVDGGFVINKADHPCHTLNDLIAEKQGEKIKSKLGQGGTTKETVLLKNPLPMPVDEEEDEPVVFDGKKMFGKK